MKTILLLTTALSLVASMALAQQVEPGADFIEQWDMNGDATVTMDEAIEKRAEIFRMFDQGDDGTLDAADWVRVVEHLAFNDGSNGPDHTMGDESLKLIHASMELEYNDTNGDGVLTAEEFAASTKTLFTQLDRNGDGVLTSADFAI
jgi:Ca2+-binding EF-hand superfamily protein